MPLARVVEVADAAPEGHRARPAPARRRARRRPRGRALLVSRGQRGASYVMPDLIGRDARTPCSRSCERAGLKVADVRYRSYPGVAPGIVLRQSPPAGQRVSSRARAQPRREQGGVVILAPSILAADSRPARRADPGRRARRRRARPRRRDGRPLRAQHLAGPRGGRGLPALTSLPIDVHLMIENAERYLDAFVDAGAASVSVHVEAMHAPAARGGAPARARRASPGVALNPSTPIAALDGDPARGRLRARDVA